MLTSGVHSLLYLMYMPVKIENNHISLSVRDLVRLNQKSEKMLSSFPLPQRGLLGKKAQVKTQQQKNKSFGLFHQEYAVNGDFHYNGFNFIVNGRIDGVYEIRGRIEVEEIKSVILTAAAFKNLIIDQYPEFSEQVLFYCYLLQKEKNGVEVIPYLTLINLVNDKTRTFPVSFSPLQTEKLLFSRFQMIIDDVLREKKRTGERISELKRLKISLTEHRPQQQNMMQAVSKVLENERHLMVSAPTGTGKTAAVLHPALEFAVEQNKKIYFATSKTTQQNIVRETVRPFTESRLQLKILFLRSAAKMCANNIFFCHEDFCPFAKNYSTRLSESNLLALLLEKNQLDPDFIFEQARSFQLCPSEVMMDLSAYADVIVGDYNYVFDPAAFLRRLFQQKDYSDWILIIDEAHNLYQRGIGYFTPALERQEISNVIRWHKNKKAKVYKDVLIALKEIEKILKDLHKEGETYHEGSRYFQLQPSISRWRKVFGDYEAAFIKYLIHKVRKKILMQDDPFEVLYYKLRHFVHVLQIENDAFIPFYDAESSGILKIQCCDPSEHLSSRINGFHSVIAMSATLDPIDYYKHVLGFPESLTDTLQLDSPFPTENRRIVILPEVTTRLQKRAEMYPAYAEIIEKTIQVKSGNYIAFFPSFEFLQNVNLFLGRVKSEKILQRSGMDESYRDAVLLKLKDNISPKLLLAVLGGIFSEGVDFSGDMCIGVIIFSPALPAVSYERELIRNYYEQKNGNGFDYAYLYPGINKVIQAVGRLIRSKQDRGIVLLVDDRFADEHIQNMLPDYWFNREGDVIIENEYEKAISDFWHSLK